MILHPNGLPFGTVRRAPAPSFAHAILLDQGELPYCWQIVDLYGPTEVALEERVKDWKIVYTPEDDADWEQQ